MKFGLIRERKNPPDKRVVLSPEACVEVQKKFPGAEIIVESSPIRVFKDAALLRLNLNSSRHTKLIALSFKLGPPTQ